MTQHASHLQRTGEGSQSFGCALTTSWKHFGHRLTRESRSSPSWCPIGRSSTSHALWSPPVPHRNRRWHHSGRSILFSVWALVPALTFGWCTPFTFTYAALRMRSALLRMVYRDLRPRLRDLLSSAFERQRELLGGEVGTTWSCWRWRSGEPSLALRSRLMSGPTPQQVALADANAASAVAMEGAPAFRHQLRFGRRVADRSSRPAASLRRRRSIDVNHAPPSALAEIPGISNELAEQISLVRDGIGGFDSLDDLSVTLGLAPQWLDRAAEFLVFRRASKRSLAGTDSDSGPLPAAPTRRSSGRLSPHPWPSRLTGRLIAPA